MVQTEEVSLKDLSAAEILALLEPATPPRELLKVAFKELAALGLLRLERAPRQNRFSLQVMRLRLTAGAAPGPLLAELLGHLRSALRHGPEMHRVLARLQREFGATYGGFRARHVLPRLVAGGLLEPHTHKVLLVFSATQHRHTAPGRGARARLLIQMAQARGQAARLAQQIPDSPGQVAALVAGLGAAVILMPELWPHFAQLNELMRPRPDGSDGGSSFAYGSADDPSSRPGEGLGDLEAAFADVDGGFDSSDGGDGGDGGGE